MDLMDGPEKLIQNDLNSSHDYSAIESLILDTSISEILINDYQNILYEKSGVLYNSNLHFPDEKRYEQFIHQICLETAEDLSFEKPALETQWKGFRLELVHSSISGSSHLVSLRRMQSSPKSLDYLIKNGACSPESYQLIKTWLEERKNILVVGPTSSGKTTILNALTLELKNERLLVLEDTEEITVDPQKSAKLLTRSGGDTKPIELSDLIKISLRLRPDRIIVGEVRGQEAKDLLLALSTGHSGSMCTLHASSAEQALSRLEILIKMGAPYWDAHTVRSLIFQGIQGIICVSRNIEGRVVSSLHEICSLEDCGFTLQTLYQRSPQVL